MKKILFAITLLACLGVLSGCMTSRNVTNITNLTGANVIDPAMKKGVDCSTYILGLIGPFGDSTIRSAAQKAKIRQISYIDYLDTYYILYGERCTVVYGK